MLKHGTRSPKKECAESDHKRRSGLNQAYSSNCFFTNPNWKVLDSCCGWHLSCAKTWHSITKEGVCWIRYMGLTVSSLRLYESFECSRKGKPVQPYVQWRRTTTTSVWVSHFAGFAVPVALLLNVTATEDPFLQGSFEKIHSPWSHKFFSRTVSRLSISHVCNKSTMSGWRRPDQQREESWLYWNCCGKVLF